MIDLDTSTPDPVVTTTDLGDLPKATLRNTLRQTIFIAVVLVLVLGAVLLLGESQEPLHSALDRHEYDEAIRLIRLGANVNAVSANGEVPLVLASDDASADAYDVVRELLRVGARVDETDSEGNTALHQAAYHGNMAVVDLLMRNGRRYQCNSDLRDHFRRVVGNAASGSVQEGALPGWRVPNINGSQSPWQSGSAEKVLASTSGVWTSTRTFRNQTIFPRTNGSK